MPHYRIFRMKDSPRQHFRWAPHVSGTANVKLRDYEEAGGVEALHDYDAWRILREQGTPLLIGDLLEGPDAQLRICKYVGFEPAQWIVPEVRQQSEPRPAPVEPSAMTT